MSVEQAPKFSKEYIAIEKDVLEQIKNQKQNYAIKNPEVKNFDYSDTLRAILKEFGLWDDSKHQLLLDSLG